jgi:sugar lactone lactonase YvrE
VITPVAGLRGTPGSSNGVGNAARFNRPYGAAITLDGNILLADQNNHALRLVSPAGNVTTFSGGTPGYRDGARAQALFNSPQDVDIDSRGVIYVSDNGNHRIRRISTGSNVTTFAGDGAAGFSEGAGTAARFFGQEGLAVKRDGSVVYVADGDNGDDGPFNRVRKLTVQ